VGALIEARFGGGAEWFAGSVTEALTGGFYDILYDDGDSESGVAADMIRPRGGGNKWREVNDDGSITTMHADGSTTTVSDGGLTTVTTAADGSTSTSHVNIDGSTSTDEKPSKPTVISKMPPMGMKVLYQCMQLPPGGEICEVVRHTNHPLKVDLKRPDGELLYNVEYSDLYHPPSDMLEKQAAVVNPIAQAFQNYDHPIAQVL
jgi:hypothetical protein